jgi:hypothetical protein
MLCLIILVKPPSKVNRSYMVERVDRLSEGYALTIAEGADIGRQGRRPFRNALRTTRSTLESQVL